MAEPRRAPLTPAMQRVIDSMARAKRPPLHSLDPVQARAAYEAGVCVLEVPTAPMARAEDLLVPASDGQLLRARLYVPTEGRLPVLLYFHGGGFTIGSVRSHEPLCRELARLSGCAVVSLDYRLAPEHRFTQAVDDAWDAVLWLHKQGHALGLDASRMAVGGDSAGGTLAAVCAMLARDHGLPLAMQLLFYPGSTGSLDTESQQAYAQGHVLDRELLQWFYAQALGDMPSNDWRFAPLYAEHHDDVAPAWIGLAECDPLFDDGILYADTLRAAGVPVSLEVYRGVTHEFIKMGRAIPEARQAHADAARALTETLKP